jgi:molybdate transport system substrate-binding protein
MSIDGIDVVGPFPEPFQKHTDFSAAVFTDSEVPELAAAFVEHLCGGGEVYARCGLEPRT